METKGLLFIWADVDPRYREEYRKWHNCEHMTERVTTPGFYAGRRYQGIGDAPQFLMTYETVDAKVFSSEPYLYKKNHPSPWTSEIIRHFGNNGRAILSLVASVGQNAPTETPYIFIARFNPEKGNKKGVVKWFKERHLPEISSLQGFFRGRLYERDEGISNIVTTEQKISGSSTGQHDLFAWYDLASFDLPAFKKLEEIYKEMGLSQKLLRDLKTESYWLDFALYAPEVKR